MEPIGARRWAIAEGYIPGGTEHRGRALESHETVCLLNAGDRDAQVTLTVYFADREPAGPFHAAVPARRTLHLRFNDLRPALPRDTDFASVIESDVPIVAQHTRLDSREPALALMTTVAFAG